MGSVKDKEAVYYNYRESEVKHGRFAMTAFLAIFFEEADRSAVLHQLGQVKIEDKLDGTLGLDEVRPRCFWPAWPCRPSPSTTCSARRRTVTSPPSSTRRSAAPATLASTPSA